MARCCAALIYCNVGRAFSLFFPCVHADRICTQRCEEWETICASITLSSLPLCLDTTAGKGVLMRKGAGSVKHLDVQSLWVQECIKSRNVVMFKIAREDSPADAFAGSSSATDFTRHVHSLLTKLEYRACRLLKQDLCGLVSGQVSSDEVQQHHGDTWPRRRWTHCRPKMMCCHCATGRDRCFVSSINDTQVVAQGHVGTVCKGSGQW